MAILIVQFSDLHAHTTNNPITERWDALCRAVGSELSEITTCVVVFCGDAAWGGKSSEFSVTAGLINALASYVRSRSADISINVISVPGNHDVDLTSEDQTARVTLRKSVLASRPPASVERILLEPLTDYFQFSTEVAGGVTGAITGTSPFYSFVDVAAGGRTIRFHLINSAWTSIIHETTDLRYPLEELKFPTVPTADFAITVMHHPYHWFLMPEVRRDLREQVEGNSDLVLTGHEHENELSAREVGQGPNLSYLEGGVLQDGDRPALCTFNVVRLDLEGDSRLVKQYYWKNDHFAVQGEPQVELLMLNSLRRDRKLRLSADFERQLDELDDLVNHPRASDVRLSQIFSYPDLRKHEKQDTEAVDVQKPHTPIFVRIRSEKVYDEISKQQFCLILGGDKAGKTSIAKRFFTEFHRVGRAPLLLRGKDLSSSGSLDGLNRTLAKLVKEQYRSLSFEQYLQLSEDQRTLVLDDLHEARMDQNVRRRTLKQLADVFGRIVLVSSNEFYLEVLSEQGSSPVEFVPYKLYDICDFGQARLHDLAGRWIKLRKPDVTTEELKTNVRDLCAKVELVLGTAGLPHTPWLLVVMIENAESADAASGKNGEYGKLYEAVITVALHKSLLKTPDIDGKYLYLARLAHHLFKQYKATISEADARVFHEDHCKKYDWTIGFEKLLEDLIRIKILRQDGDGISFRYKYLYCYFVANWLQRNIHLDDARVEVHDLAQRLDHDISASILVMLASLTQDPVVLSEMRLGAGSLYAKQKPATMVEEVRKLNELDVPNIPRELPATSPDENRKLLHEAHDDVRVKHGNENHDGRLVKATPDVEEDLSGDDTTKIVIKEIRQIRAALRTMDILGQVLRNAATSQTAEEKLAIMEEIIALGRRVLGFFYHFTEDMSGLVGFAQDIFQQLSRNPGDAERASAEQPKATGDPVGTTNSDGPHGDDNDSREEARLLANKFWFDLYSLGSHALVTRMGTALSLKALDPTMRRLLSKDPVLVNKLVEIEMQLNRPDPNIPSEQIVALHKQLKQDGNRVAQVVLQSLVFERLMMFETSYRDIQRLGDELNIKRMPAKIYDANPKKFTPRS